MEITKGSLTVRIEEELDSQATKYVNLSIFTDEHELEGLLLNKEDMEVIKDALVKYFDTSK